MANPELSVDRRTETGKGAARKMRSAGRIPGVFYGTGVESVALSLDPKELGKMILQASSNQFLLNLNVAGEVQTAMLKEFQVDPVSRQLLHADFQRVQADQAIELDVALEFLGEPEGVKLGGIFEVREQSISLSGLPGSLPEAIKVDVSSLGIGDSIKVADLELPETIEAVASPATVVCAVTVKAEVEEEVVEAEEEEAEAAEAEGEAEAAPPEEGEES